MVSYSVLLDCGRMVCAFEDGSEVWDLRGTRYLVEFIGDGSTPFISRV